MDALFLFYETPDFEVLALDDRSSFPYLYVLRRINVNYHYPASFDIQEIYCPHIRYAK